MRCIPVFGIPVFTKGLGQGVGLTFMHLYWAFKPKTLQRHFVNTGLVLEESLLSRFFTVLYRIIYTVVLSHIKQNAPYHVIALHGLFLTYVTGVIFPILGNVYTF